MSKKLPVAVKTIKRRFATRYYLNQRETANDFATHGAASSEHGAIRAAVVRIFLGQYAKCVVVDRLTNTEMYQLQRGPKGLETRYAKDVSFKEWKEPK